MSEKSVKQVLVWRSDLRNTLGHRVRTGKVAAQLSHASMGAILSCGYVSHAEEGLGGCGHPESFVIPFKRPELQEWLLGSFTKVCVSVDSEPELLEMYAKAKELGLICCLITDNGLTEFGGIKTNTCIAIGPGDSTIIDTITGHLKLL